jgi:hypothetical protein
MKPNDAILIALLVVLVIVIAFQFKGDWMKQRDGFSPRGDVGGNTFAHQQYPGGAYNPYTVLNNELSEIRGYRNDGYNQPPVYRLPHGLDAYHRAGAHLKPEDIAEAERGQWYAATEADHSGQFNTELTQDTTSDTMQYHSASPAGDYGSYITDLIVDPRTKDNHRRWVEEMKPWSGAPMKVDDLDVEPTIDFIGLRRPQAVVVYNPTSLTEIGPEDLISNAKFNFRG